MKRPRPGDRGSLPWALVSVILVLGTQYLAQRAVNGLIASLALGHEAGILFLCLPPLACMAITTLMAMRLHSLPWVGSLRFLGLKRVEGRSVALGLILSVPILEGYYLAARNYQGHGVSVSFFPEWPFLLVLIVASAGFFEELFFRGFLFQSLRVGRSFVPAAFLSSLLWALAHWGNAFAGPKVRFVFPGMITFLLGLAGAWVFEKSGNRVWSWMIVHIAIDSIGLLNIGNTGLFRAPVGWPMAYVFIGEILCVGLAFPLTNWFYPPKVRA